MAFPCDMMDRAMVYIDMVDMDHLVDLSRIFGLFFYLLLFTRRGYFHDFHVQTGDAVDHLPLIHLFIHERAPVGA